MTVFFQSGRGYALDRSSIHSHSRSSPLFQVHPVIIHGPYRASTQCMNWVRGAKDDLAVVCGDPVFVKNQSISSRCTFIVSYGPGEATREEVMAAATYVLIRMAMPLLSKA